jgi:hypothetical protein
MINQNKKFIYVLPFETMTILASCLFFFHMNVKKSKLKIYLIQIEVLVLIWNISRWTLIVSKVNNFTKDYQNDSYNN